MDGRQHSRQPLALRVGGFFKPQPSARIAFAGQQDVGEPLGLADGVAALQKAHQRGGRQIGAAVDVAVLAGHHIGRLAAVHGHAQALGHVFQQLRTALLMPDVAGQYVGGRGALAQVMHQAGKPHGE
ncbi:hypothetical protein D3C72_1801430 [compost metagenome]